MGGHPVKHRLNFPYFSQGSPLQIAGGERERVVGPHNSLKQKKRERERVVRGK